jgi:hypothetical protein
MTSLSPAIQAVVSLFRGPLSSVRFADIDGAGLAQLASDVEAASAEVERQEAKLVELKQSLAQRQEALLVLAQQALAYARIYAENDDALSAELNEIALPRPSKPRKPAAPKSPSPSAEAEGPVETASVVEAPAEASEEPSEDAEPAAEKAPIARKKIKRRLARAS